MIVSAVPRGIAQVPAVVPDPPDAVEKYYRVLRKAPTRSHLYDRFLDAWLESRPLSELGTFFEERANAGDATAEDQMLAATHFSRKGEIEKALGYYDRALERESALPEARLGRASLLARQRAFGEAIEELDAALAIEGLEPERVLEIGKRKGRYLVREGDTAGALEVWNDLLRKNADDLFLHEDIIEAFAGEGLLDEATESARQLVEKTTDPHDRILREFRVAELLLRAGREEAAIELYERALPRTGSESWLEREILERISAIHRRRDDIEGLRSRVDRLAESHSQRLALAKLQASLAAETGDGDGATALYLAVLRKSPGDRETRSDFVDLLVDLDRKAEAVEQQRALVAQFPKDSELPLRLAELLHANGDAEGMEQAVRSFLALSGGEESDYLRAARFLEKAGRIELAASLYAKGRETYPDSLDLSEMEAAFLLRNDHAEDGLERFRALGGSADVDQLVRITRALVAAEYPEEAFALFADRKEELGNDFSYLENYLQIAFQQERREGLEDDALRLLALVDSRETLERALVSVERLFAGTDRSEALVERLRKKEPQIPAETSLLAQLLNRGGETEAAVALLNDAAGRAEGESRELFLRQLVSVHHRNKEWEEAASLLRKLHEETGSRSSRNVQDLVTILREAGREEEAVEWIAEWKTLSPGSLLPWTVEAELLQRIDRGDEAVAALRSAMAKFPDENEIVLRLAALHYDIGDPGEATRLYWKLYEDTEEPMLRLRRVGDLHRIASFQGTVSELLETFEERRRSNPQSTEPLLAIAEIHRLESDWPAREQALVAASRLREDDLRLYLDISDAKLEQGDVEGALATLERARPFDRTPGTRQRMARIQLEQGDPQEGYAILTELAGELDAANTPQALLIEEIADVMIGNGDYDLAAEYLTPFLKTFPGNYRLRYLRAIALEENGEFEEATVAFLELLTWDRPEDERDPLWATFSREDRERWEQINKGYTDPLSALPMGVAPWHEAAQQFHEAYSHRIENRFQPLDSLGSLVERRVLPPIRRELLRPWALTHLVEMARTNSGGIEEVGPRLAEAGVPHADLFLEFGDWSSAAGSRAIPREILREHPDHIDLHAKWIMDVAMTWEGSDYEMVDYLRAARLLLDSHPDLAVAAALIGSAWTPDPLLLQVRKDAMERIPDSGTDSFFLQLAWSQVTGTRGGHGRGRLDDETLQRLAPELVRLILADAGKSYRDSRLVFVAASMILEAGEPVAAVRFLQEVVTVRNRLGEPSAAEGVAAWNRFQGIRQLSYSVLGSYPFGVSGFLRSMRATDPHPSRPEGFHQPTPADLEAMLAEASDPVIRFFLEKVTLEEKAFEERLRERIKDAEVSGVELALAGSWFEEMGRPAEAVALFVQARNRLPGRLDRQLLDSAIMVGATGAGQEEESAWKEGQQAALRLVRTVAIPPQTKSYVASILKGLELEREAGKLLREDSNRSAVASVVRSQKTQPHQKITDLVAAGKTEAAVAFAAREVAKVGREAIQDRYGSWRNNFYYLQRAVSESGLATRIFDEVARKNGDRSVERMMETAVAAELFQQRERAREIYLSILETRPDDVKATARLAWLKLTEEGAARHEEVAGMLDRVELANLEAVLGEVIVGFDGIGYSQPEGTTIYAMTLACIEAIAKREDELGEQTAAFLLQLHTHIFYARDWGGVEAAFLHDRAPLYGDRGRPHTIEENRRADEMRFRAYDRFCELAFRQPSLNRLAFTTRCAWELARGGDPAEWEARAEELAGRFDPTQLNYSQRLGGREADCLPLYGPEEFLIHQAWKKEDRSAADSVIEGAPEALRPELEAFRDLYFGPVEDFPRLAKRFQESYGRTSKGSSFQVPYEYHVCWAIADRGLAYEAVATWFRDEMTISNGNMRQPPDWFRTFLTSIEDLEGFPGFPTLLRDLRAMTLGEDLEAIREEVKKETAANGGRISYSGQAGGFAYNCLCNLAQDERLLFATMEVARETGFSYDAFFDRIWRYRNGEYFQNEANVRAFLANAPWFGEIAGIDLGVSSAFRDSGSLMGEFFRSIDDGLPRAAAREAIEAGHDSFFKELALGMLEQPKSGRAPFILAAIGKHLAEFQALEESRVRAWVRMLEDAGLADAPGLPADSPAGRARDWLTAQGMKNAESRLTDFLAASRFSEVEASPERFEKEMTKLIASLVTEAPGRAADVFHQGWRLIRKEQLAGGWRGSYSYNGWPVGSEILDDWFADHEGGLSELAFWVAVQQADDKGQVPHSGWSYDFKFTPRLRKAIDRAGGPVASSKAVPVMLAELRALVGEDPEDHAATLGLPFYDLVKNYPAQHRAALVLAADEVAARDRPESRLAEHLAMAGRFFLASAPPDQVSEKVRASVPDLDRWRAHAIRLVGDESKPGSWRVPLANLYAHNGIEAVDDELALSIGRAVADAFEADHSFNAWNLLHCLRAFCPREELPEWPDIAARIEAGWWKKNRHNGESRYTGKPFDPVPDAILAAMELSLRLGKPGAYNRYRQVFGNDLVGYRHTRSLLLLVEHGHHREALDLLRNPAVDFDGAYYYPESRYYNARLTPENRAEVETFLDGIDDPDLARYARALLEMAPDLPWPQLNALDLPEPWVARGGRMMRAAREFDQVPWKSDALRRRTLQPLVLEPQTSAPLAKVLAAEFAATDPVQVIRTANHLEIETGMRLVAAHCWNEMKKGNLEPFRATWESIASAPGSSTYRNEAREEMARFIWFTLRRSAFTMPSEELAPVLEACQLVMESYDANQTHFTDHDALVAAWVVAASLAGKTDEARRWLADLHLEQFDKGKLLTSMDTHHQALFPTLTQMLKTGAPKDSSPTELRQRVLIDFFGNPLIQSSFLQAAPMKNNLFAEIVKRKILTRAQLLEIDEELHRSWSRGGRAAIELREFAKAENDLERRLRWSARVTEELTDRTPTTQRVDALLHHAEALLAADRKSEAKEVLAKLPPEPGQVGRLENLRNKLP